MAVQAFAKGQIHIPQTLVVQASAGHNVNCDGAVGKLELNFNIGTDDNAFTPALQLCTKTGHFGKMEFEATWQVLKNNSWGTKIIKQAVAGFVYLDQTVSEDQPQPLISSAF